MKKLKCSSCGAQLEVEGEYAVCKHCGSKYKLNEDLNVNIKLDDNVKDILNNGLGTVKHFSWFMLIPVIGFIIVFVTIIVFSFKKFNSYDNTLDNSHDEFEENFKTKQEEIKEQQIKAQEETKKTMFNFRFQNDNGTKNDFFLSYILDDIIESNKTSGRTVILVFDGKEVTDEKEIIDIKHSLNGDYEVSFNYDSDGYIDKIIVERIS